MSITSVRVNTGTYAATHVATNMLFSVRSIVKSSGLNPDLIRRQWAILETGLATWLSSGHLKTLTLEVYDSTCSGSGLVGRFDFSIDYGYYPGADGELWLDPDTVAHAVRKAGSFPGRCEYLIIAHTAPWRPEVPGWTSCNYRSTDGFARHVVGTAIGGGSVGASLAYYTRSSK